MLKKLYIFLEKGDEIIPGDERYSYLTGWNEIIMSGFITTASETIRRELTLEEIQNYAKEENSN